MSGPLGDDELFEWASKNCNLLALVGGSREEFEKDKAHYQDMWLRWGSKK